MVFSITGIIMQIIVNAIFVAPILWIAGRMFVGGEKAKFIDAIWIVALGAIIGAIVGVFSSGIIGSIIQFLVWLYLVKSFFDCGWLKALAISIVAIVVSAILLAVLAIIGISLLT